MNTGEMKIDRSRAQLLAGGAFILCAIAFALTGNWLLGVAMALIGVSNIVVGSQAADASSDGQDVAE